MDHLVRLKDSFVQYLSPSAKRRRTTGPTTPSNNAAPVFLPHSEPQILKAEASVLAHITNNYYTTPPAKNARKRPRQDDDEAEQEPSYISALFDSEDADITSITEDDSYAISPNDSISQIIPRTDCEGGEPEDVDEDMMYDDESGEEFEDEFEEEEEEEVEEEVNVEDAAAAKVREYLARQAELALRKEDVAKVKAEGAHPDALFLFERIAMRSFEEVLPASWQIDFSTLPEVLFTEDPKKQFINFNNIPSHRGVKALQSLLSLGVRVRDNVFSGAPTERLIAREIKSYIKWSEKDGGFSKLRFLPVLTVVTGRPREPVSSIGTSINSQLKFLAERHREHLATLPLEPGESAKYIRNPPLLYGIIIAQTMTIIVTLDSSNPDAIVKHLTDVQFKNKNMDVWNELAIAFTIIMSRNYIMSIEDELEPDDESEVDPDL